MRKTTLDAYGSVLATLGRSEDVLHTSGETWVFETLSSTEDAHTQNCTSGWHGACSLGLRRYLHAYPQPARAAFTHFWRDVGFRRRFKHSRIPTVLTRRAAHSRLACSAAAAAKASHPTRAGTSTRTPSPRVPRDLRAEVRLNARVVEV